MLAMRGDLLLVYSAFSEVTQKILTMLMGLNRIYHPELRWMHRLIDEMTITPRNLSERIQWAFQSEPLAAMAILRDLMVEKYDLINSYMPDVETAQARIAFLRQRPQVSVMPDGIDLAKVMRSDTLKQRTEK